MIDRRSGPLSRIGHPLSPRQIAKVQQINGDLILYYTVLELFGRRPI
jgi:hypothetical protein